MKSPLLPFLEVRRGEAVRHKVFTHRSDVVRSQRSGREGQIDRLITPDWVNVVAFNEAGELLLVRQWRFGSMAFSVELPAGVMEAGEDPITAGLRELREETGHTPVDVAAVEVLGASRPNPAFMDNRCFTIIVPQARLTHPQALDPLEEVEVLTLHRDAVDDAIRAGVEALAAPSPSPSTSPSPSPSTSTSKTIVFDNAMVLVATQLWRLWEARRAAS